MLFVVDQNQNEAVQTVIKVQSDAVNCADTEAQAGAVNHADTEAQAGAVNGAVTSAEVMTGGVAEVSLNTSEPQTNDDTHK